MRRIHNYITQQESYSEMTRNKRFNPCLEITFKDKSGKHTHKLFAGYSDVLDVYREGSITYVLSTNSGLEYVGLEVFEGAQKLGDVFLQGYQIKEVLGSKKAPHAVIKHLEQYT